MLVGSSGKPDVCSRVCPVTLGERGSPVIAELQAEGEKGMEMATPKKDREDQEEGGMGGEGKSRKAESCWGSGLGKAIINILNGVPTT